MALSSSTTSNTLKNLDDHHVWTLKHRHWSIELAVDEGHNIWINTSDLRVFYEYLPKDRELQAGHRSGLLFVKSVKTYYLSERSMRVELAKSKRYSCHSDVLKFLDWFERNISSVSEKRRANQQLDSSNQRRQELEKTINVGPVPGSLAPPQLDADTVPFTEQERWVREQPAQEVPRVFHRKALAKRTTWSDWRKATFDAAIQLLLSFWRGERNFFLTFAAGVILALVPDWVFLAMVPDSLDWTESYKRVMWGFAIVAPVALLCAIVFTVSMTRCTRTAWRHPGGKLWATTLYLLILPMGPGIFFANYDSEMIGYWWASVRGKYQPINIYADPHLGRIVVQGPIEFGSADALERTLSQNPKYTLLQIESPGGYVIEGMRMAQIVQQRKMDTVALESCASACTFVLAAGADRYLGPHVKVGFHRSGRRFTPVSTGWSETDHQIAKYYRERGVNGAFVAQALTPSIREIWVAPHTDMYAAGYANLMWSERKNGY